MTTETPNYKDSLSITRTDFPQRAGLAKSEPERMAHWDAIDLDALIEKKGLGRPKYVLHDGPPYANGDIHLGHALNKTLKDIVVRYRTMAGFASTYVPGFDCHGLPIEQKVIEKLGNKIQDASSLEIRRMCHEYATRYIGLQTEQFRRLGVGGDWEHPYLTLEPGYEVGILEALREMVAGGYVYKGYKPVYWDTRFQTALAEAEIEYEDHESPSIYVRFPILNPEICEPLKDQGACTIVIWTTTPWTLPANLAVSVHPDLDYVLIEAGGEKIVCARGRMEPFCEEAGLGEPKILAKFDGTVLEGLRCKHPLMDKESTVILGDHVTLEQGTGCVHTAPGHGVEDFLVCQANGIEVFQPVDERGCYSELYPDMQGEFVWKANPKIVEKLKEKNLLVWVGTIRHQYPHSWRSHEPVIVRATDQWFMNVDHRDLRKKCLEAIDESVQWIPNWGHDRIYNMMTGRPDWCLSRQRSWGVPIPSIYSVKAKQSLLLPEVIDKFAEFVAKEGTDCWFARPVEDFLPEGFVCPISGGSEFEKEADILDVWFDSGSSHISVLENDERLQSPADMYLEGSDQHRGWFMSSMTVSMATRERAPYKTVLTHGFLLDGQGQAMSKSKGNVISPLDIVNQMGADILRLWVISEDYRNDVAASMDIFKQTSEAYRRIRNTMRFLLGNLTDFNPATDMVAVGERLELDRWALANLAVLIRRVERAYEVCEFHKIYHAVHQFCAVTMSALYLDIIKDRLYCSAPDDSVRRAAQSTVWNIFDALVKMLAPVMPFTCDEAYDYGHPVRESIHLEDFPKVDPDWEDAGLIEKWERILEAREVAMRPLEEARREKRIGKSLDAALTLKPRTADMARFLDENIDLLREVCIVSKCTIDRSGADREKADSIDESLEVQTTPAPGEKCPRCWTITENAGANSEHPALCPRCADVMRRLS